MDFPPLAPDRFSGRKLGKYEVLCKLSTGGMAEIYLAFQRGVAGFRKLVVLKKILPDIDEDDDIVRMFLDEARMTAQFNHPNIAQVFDLDVVDGELFLAMEFVPGATLIEVAQLTRKGNEDIPVGFTLAACRDTALALHYAHTFKDALGRQKHVIHRDIAEKNIMVTYDGTTKLLDFGIAKAKGRVTSTAIGKVKGTSGYMSPEQVVGEELDARSDIFSLGIVMHECLTGMRLFYGTDAESGMLAALNQVPSAPSEANPDVGRELDAVVLKALARKREDRFTTALDMAKAIEKASSGRIWRPEQSGAFIQRVFHDRREQTRVLLEGSSGNTGEIDLQALFKNAKKPLPEKEKEKERPEKQNPQADAIAMLKSVAQPNTPRGQQLPGTPMPAPSQALKSNPDLRQTMKGSEFGDEHDDEATVLNPKGSTREATREEDDEDAAERTIPVEMQGRNPSGPHSSVEVTEPPKMAPRRPPPIARNESRTDIAPREKRSPVAIYVAAGLALAAALAAAAWYFHLV